jgi:5-methyltetrahydropteroyltriglutamate--homocysteine methyltransferase
MTQTGVQRIVRADNVGSFLRPKELLDARLGGAAPEELRAIEDRHILRVLDKQKELGLRIFTDGEFRRAGFMSDFTEAVEGIGGPEVVKRKWIAKEGDELDQSAYPRSSMPGFVQQKIRRIKRLTAHEVPFLKEHAPGPIKMTLPSATQFPAIAYKKGVSEKAYPTHSDFLRDVTAIIRDEVKALADDGIPYIQIDAPRYSYYLDPQWRDFLQSETGMSIDALLDEAIAADNACLAAGRRADNILAIHLCRGNNRSHWYARGGYDAIAEKLFNELAVDEFLLEYDDERSGSFEPLRLVPKEKSVVLGLVSSKVPELEDADFLLRRIDEATKYIPLERLALSPQCGFASTLEGNLLTEDQQWAKLELVAEVARRVWGST